MNRNDLQKSINESRARLGAGLFQLALKWSRESPTIAEREAALKATKRRRKSIDGRRGVAYLCDQTNAVARLIRDSRRERNHSRPQSPHTHSRSVLLPTGSMESRLATRVGAEVASILNSTYRLNDAGTCSVRITRDPTEVGVAQTESLDWDYYSKRTKYTKKITTTVVTVPAAWWIRVRNAGLAEVGGLLTLDAQRAEGGPADVDLFAVTWIEQARGYELRTERGYIARGHGQTYHGFTPQSALRGLNRKVTGQQIDTEIAGLLAKHGIAGMVERNPSLSVSVSDARLSGSCEYGIRSWCARCGLPYDEGSAPLSQVFECYRMHPMPEARAAILHALKRQKRAVLKAAA